MQSFLCRLLNYVDSFYEKELVECSRWQVADVLLKVLFLHGSASAGLNPFLVCAQLLFLLSFFVIFFFWTGTAEMNSLRIADISLNFALNAHNFSVSISLIKATVTSLRDCRAPITLCQAMMPAGCCQLSLNVGKCQILCQSLIPLYLSAHVPWI